MAPKKGEIHRYTEEQQAAFCEMAQEFGIGRTIRELGYPKSYAAAESWMKKRGIEPNRDVQMQTAKLWHHFYQLEDLLEQIDQALSVAQELLLTAKTADDMKKLSESLQKLVNTRLLLEGKATSIAEKRETSKMDLEIMDLINQQRAANALTESQLVESETA